VDAGLVEDGCGVTGRSFHARLERVELAAGGRPAASTAGRMLRASRRASASPPAIVYSPATWEG
jgi:hypothetical protein